jgi:hypothetical protein
MFTRLIKMSVFAGAMVLAAAASAGAGEFRLVRSQTSSAGCLDFLFGIGGSTQSLVETVDVVVHPGGIALGFEASETGDLSDLRTRFKTIAPGTWEIFPELEEDEESAKARFTTGVGGYVHWRVELSETAQGFRLTSTSREGFGLGAETVQSCELSRI